MKIGIVGGGSIGLLISSYLSEQHEITIYVRRKEQKERINKFGLYINERLVRKGITALLLKELKPESCLIFCVKQTELSQILPLIQFNDKTPLVFLQNGMGHLDMIQSMPQPLFLGIVEHGAVRLNDYQIKQTGKGKIKLASFKATDRQLMHLTRSLHQLNFPFKGANDSYRLLSEKLVINTVINPLTALFRVRNRHIIENQYLKSIAKKLCEEAVKTLGLNFKEQWERVKEIARNTGDNRSSMLMDIENARQTEIEAITGYLINLKNHDMPYTQFIYQSLKAIETQKGINK